jgi:hypothetical protein
MFSPGVDRVTPQVHPSKYTYCGLVNGLLLLLLGFDCLVGLPAILLLQINGPKMFSKVLTHSQIEEVVEEGKEIWQ